MNHNIITPAIGDPVWYWPDQQDLPDGRTGTVPKMACYNEISLKAQPMSATVCRVHNDFLVNLQVIDHNGQSFSRTAVRLVQGDEKAPADQRYCEWPQYEDNAQPIDLGTVGPATDQLARGPVGLAPENDHAGMNAFFHAEADKFSMSVALGATRELSSDIRTKLIELGWTPPGSSIREQADAWSAVFKALEANVPGWRDGIGENAGQKAVNSIAMLARRVKLLERETERAAKQIIDTLEPVVNALDTMLPGWSREFGASEAIIKLGKKAARMSHEDHEAIYGYEEAWKSVTSALNEAVPDWHLAGTSGMLAAVATIRELAKRPTARVPGAKYMAAIQEAVNMLADSKVSELRAPFDANGNRYVVQIERKS
jgi:hypothetical protein